MDYLTTEAPPGALVVSAVHGLGGIGKTTLVAALGGAEAVAETFRAIQDVGRWWP